MRDTVLLREVFKAECLAILEAQAMEHPAGHQGKLAARYVLLRSSDGERIGLMFEKGEKTQAHLWIETRFVTERMKAGVGYDSYPAAALYQSKGRDGKPVYGRHAALKAMRDLAHADLVRFTPKTPKELQLLLRNVQEDQGVYLEPISTSVEL